MFAPLPTHILKTTSENKHLEFQTEAKLKKVNSSKLIYICFLLNCESIYIVAALGVENHLLDLYANESKSSFQAYNIIIIEIYGKHYLCLVHGG